MYKIIKEIHNYNDKVVFRVYEKFLWKWIPSKDFKNHETYKLAELEIIDKFKGGLSGIVTVDNNVYSFSSLSLPVP